MRLFRQKITDILTFIILCALALALLAQRNFYERQDRALKARLGRALKDKYAQEGMDRILTDQGTDIFKHCLSVELLRRSGTSVTSTGIMLEKDAALRAACVLLDHRNFGGDHDYDEPSPQVGLRISDGHSTLDILIDLEEAPKQCVWIMIHDERGKQVHLSGPTCINDPTLQKLGEQLLRLLGR